MTEGEIELDCLEERAALIQEGDGCSRYMAELMAATQAGYTNWSTARKSINDRIRKEKGQ
jgi:hypothetical protein